MQVLDWKTVDFEKYDRMDLDEHREKGHLNDGRNTLGEDKDIIAVDFEVLTDKHGITRPAMLGICKIKSDGELLKPEVLHKYQSKRWIDCDPVDLLHIILMELTAWRFCNSINFFYNIKYDMNIIIKLFPLKKRRELITRGAVTWRDFHFEIYGNKFFIIERISEDENQRNKRAYFYDLANFTYRSLEDAVEEWLNIPGFKGDFETDKVFTDRAELLEQYQMACLYCKRDVKHTAKLAHEVRKTFISMNIPFDRPFSSASLLKRYIQYNDIQFPNISNKRIERLSYASFHGGCFDVIRRGYFPEVVGFDVNSMYPSIQAEIPNINTCRIAGDTKVDRSADWGLIKCRIWLDPDCPAPPLTADLKVRTRDQEGRSNLRKKKTRVVASGQKFVISKQMFDFLTGDDFPYLQKLDVNFAVNIYEEDRTEYPFKFLEELYQRRQELKEKHGRGDKREKVLKIIINSAYGKMAEVIKNRNYIKSDEGMYFRDPHNPKSYRPGSMFRPFYAKHITELGRLMLFETVYKYDLIDNLIALATDCLYLIDDENIKDFANSDLIDFKELGKWDLETRGEGIFLGNGMYQIRENNGDLKKVTRGFHSFRFPDLFELKESDKTSVIVENYRPLTARECWHKNINTEKTGAFQKFPKLFNINMDISREWQDDFESISDAFCQQIESDPIQLPPVKYHIFEDTGDILYNENKNFYKELEIIEKVGELHMDHEYKEIEKFKNAMIWIGMDDFDRYFKKPSKKEKIIEEKGSWVTVSGNKVLLFNDLLWTGNVPSEWQGFSFAHTPWVESEAQQIADVVISLLAEKKDMIDLILNVLENELRHGQSPQTYTWDDEYGDMQLRRSKSTNPPWFNEKTRHEYYDWLTLQSLSKDQVFSALENRNEWSQLYQDLRYLAHKILYEGDPIRNYPPDQQYKDCIIAIKELIEELKKYNKENENIEEDKVPEY